MNGSGNSVALQQSLPPTSLIQHASACGRGMHVTSKVISRNDQRIDKRCGKLPPDCMRSA
jgi:hypothetical protein